MHTPIDSIVIGQRRREDMGDIQELAESIRRFGLLHPVVVDVDTNLVAGGRRLEACKLLGWPDVPVRMLDSLTEAERREIELEENLRRKDLTLYEQRKELVRKAKEIAPLISAKLAEKDPRGRKSELEAPKADIAQGLSTTETDLRRAETYITTADTYPFMQQPHWKQYHVLEARERLEKLPEAERQEAAAIIDEPAIPPKTAIEILSNLSEMPPRERAEIFALRQSEDPRDRSLAKTKLVNQPPMPDPRIFVIKDAIDKLRYCAREFPKDPLTPRIKETITDLETIRETIRGAART